jgi:pyrroloquinoline quinone (PQQ) biosynthesis protein C
MTSEVTTFVASLKQELRDRQLSLLDADFLAAVEAGSIDRDAIARWAQTFYAATRNGRISLGAFYASSPDDPELRRELAANIYEEETGNLSGVGRCHMDVFMDFLAAFGASPTEPQPHAIRPTAAIAPDDFYIELTAYGFSVEEPNAEFCRRLHRALSTSYGFDDAQLTWFSMHAALDADHGEEFQKYALRAADEPDGLARLRQRTLERSAQTKVVWNGSGHWQ